MINSYSATEDVVGVGDDRAVAVGLRDEPAGRFVVGVFDVEVTVAVGHAGKTAEGVVGVALDVGGGRDGARPSQCGTGGGATEGVVGVGEGLRGRGAVRRGPLLLLGPLGDETRPTRQDKAKNNY